MAMADPSLMTAGGAPWDLDISADSSSLRQFLYVQIWVSFLGGNYTIGELPESAVRHIAEHELFRSQAGRNYWAAVGQVQIAHSAGRRNKFFLILNDEYNRVMSSGIPPAKPIQENDVAREAWAQSTLRRASMQQLYKLTAAVLIGVLAGRLWRHKGSQ
jgi:hypothetical protein